MDTEAVRRAKIEWLKCAKSPPYFIDTYVSVYDATSRDWIPFKLWPAQMSTLAAMQTERQIVILKARQLGLSWLTLAYVLWEMTFRPAAAVLIFSKRDEEATDLLDNRLKGMYSRLPTWMQARSVVSDNDHDWELSTGSNAKAFPTTGGRSYTGSIALIDEADYIPDLNNLLNAVKPTIDAGGKLIMLSTSDKSQPESQFKQTYRAAKRGETDWKAIFLPWHARPERDELWYNLQRADILARTGSTDDLHQEYPATDTEALSPRTLDKRIPAPWLEACYVEADPVPLPKGSPALAGLAIYAPAQKHHRYVIGCDPAEGNPTSDDSALTVMDMLSGEECAVLAGKVEPGTFAAHADLIGSYYNNAPVLVERNNHGHTVLLWLREHSRLLALPGLDGRDGWLSNALGKTMLYTQGAELFKDKQTTLHSFSTYMQLASIEGNTLLAPKGQHDDLADSYVLANMARIVLAALEALPAEGIMVQDEAVRISPI